MTYTEDQDRAFEVAKAKIQAAATEYAQVGIENAYVGEWAMVIHVQATSLEMEERSETHLVEPTGQVWHHTGGLLRAGTITHERESDGVD